MKIHGPYLRKDGRKHVVIIHDDGTRQTRSYPRLLLEAKLGRPLEEWETVDHEDGDYTNDSPSNLRVLSLSDNAKHGWVTGNSKSKPLTQAQKIAISGCKNGMCKLSDEQIQDIRSRSRYFGYVNALASEFCVTRVTIRNILQGKTHSSTVVL